MDLRINFIIAAAAAVIASAATAQTSPAQPAHQAEQPKQKDPNEMVCETQKEPGSRLAVAKVCHTRAEWADLRHQDRQMIDRAQTQLGTMGK